MAQVTQLVIRAEHKPGALAQICSELAKVAVNITAIMAANTEEHGIRLVAAPHATANVGCMLQLRAGCRREGLRAEVKHVIELLDESYRSEVVTPASPPWPRPKLP